MARVSFKQIVREITPFLNEDEILLSAGIFKERASVGLLMLTRFLARFYMPEFFAGVTDQSVIILPLDRESRHVNDDRVFRLDFSAVEFKGNSFLVYREKGSPLELRFASECFYVEDFNKNEFIGAVYHGKFSQ